MHPILGAAVGAGLALLFTAAAAADKERCRLSGKVGLKYSWVYEGECVGGRAEGRGIRVRYDDGPEGLELYEYEEGIFWDGGSRSVELVLFGDVILHSIDVPLATLRSRYRLDQTRHQRCEGLFDYRRSLPRGNAGVYPYDGVCVLDGKATYYRDGKEL